ncbi:MAG: hypothetical protein JXR10_01925, partial [Cyclobacteriaceae bacterium]
MKLKIMKMDIGRLSGILILLIGFLFDAHTQNRAEQLSAKLKNSDDPHVFVVAHRGDWRHAPENSIQAIQNCDDTPKNG